MVDRKMQCNQLGCRNRAAFRYTWPGREESPICEEHVGKLLLLANLMGLEMEVYALPEETDAKPAS